jgi:histidine triad (HIT) family protein
MSERSETIFSKIIRKEIPAKIAFESDSVLAFHDINPQAPVHVLIIPKRAIKHCGTAVEGDGAILGELLLVAGQLAKELGIAASGFRLVINNGQDAGQTVDHLHVHLLGGRALAWPPG